MLETAQMLIAVLFVENQVTTLKLVQKLDVVVFVKEEIMTLEIAL